MFLALPGLLVVILPIDLVSEIIYWLESSYVVKAFGIPAPVIAIMIAAVIAIVLTNLVNIPSRYPT